MKILSLVGGVLGLGVDASRDRQRPLEPCWRVCLWARHCHAVVVKSTSLSTPWDGGSSVWCMDAHWQLFISRIKKKIGIFVVDSSGDDGMATKVSATSHGDMV